MQPQLPYRQQDVRQAEQQLLGGYGPKQFAGQLPTESQQIPAAHQFASQPQYYTEQPSQGMQPQLQGQQTQQRPSQQQQPQLQQQPLPQQPLPQQQPQQSQLQQQPQQLPQQQLMGSDIPVQQTQPGQTFPSPQSQPTPQSGQPEPQPTRHQPQQGGEVSQQGQAVPQHAQAIPQQGTSQAVSQQSQPVQQEMASAAQQTGGGMAGQTSMQSTTGTVGMQRGIIAVDIMETPDELRVYADVPGFDPDDVEVLCDDSTLTLLATRNVEDEDEASWIQRERPTEIQRELQLPARAVVDEAEATIEDGVCTITLPKSEEGRQKRIGFQ